MHRASETIGAIAASLAKAQAELANPERTLTATLTDREGRERDFRYASLAQGLDIARKSLGRYEIAVMQTTAVEGGQIMLTTLLVHSSGEWVSSCWPVCPLSEASHRAKGAALTYARRYALFTLVGIAGEDDLDAPDLPVSPCSPPMPQNGPPVAAAASAGSNPTPPILQRPAGQTPAGRPGGPLSPAASEQLVRSLEVELASISEPDALAMWALRAMPLKNRLLKLDADQLEAAFLAKIGGLGDNLGDPSLDSPDRLNDGALPNEPPDPVDGIPTVPVVPIRKPIRQRDRNHLRFISAQSCLVCGRAPTDAHHVKFAEPIAMGRKVSDRFTVPLCRLHHRELHRRGNERAWWKDQGIDPLSTAATLWKRTHEEPSPGSRAREIDRRAGHNEEILNGSMVEAPRPIDETKPICRPEAQ